MVGQILHYLAKVFSGFWLKIIIGLVWASLVPHHTAIVGLAFLFCLDLIFGIWVGIQTRTLSSYGMRRGVAKLTLYVAFMSAVAVAEHTVFGTTVATLAAIGLLSATELLSVTENLVLLGLPIPFAAQVLKLVQSKSQALGVNVGDDPNAAAAIKDMVDLLQYQIPSVRSEPLRDCLDEFVTHHYYFMRNLRSGLMVGSSLLVGERIGGHLDLTIQETRLSLERKGLPTSLISTFLDGWCGSLLTHAAQQIQQVCGDDQATQDQKIDRIRDQICLMCLRLIRDAQKLDRDSDNPLTQFDQHVLEPASVA